MTNRKRRMRRKPHYDHRWQKVWRFWKGSHEQCRDCGQRR